MVQFLHCDVGRVDTTVHTVVPQRIVGLYAER
jgi:hypothetical protein